MKVVSSCGNDAMPRQVTEAILIKEQNPEFNTKDERGTSNTLRERDRIRRDNLPRFFKEDIMRTRNTRQSGNDARLRTGGSKIEGWNTASHVVKILI